MEKMWMICNINGTCKMCNCRGMIWKWCLLGTPDNNQAMCREFRGNFFETGVNYIKSRDIFLAVPTFCYRITTFLLSHKRGGVFPPIYIFFYTLTCRCRCCKCRSGIETANDKMEHMKGCHCFSSLFLITAGYRTSASQFSSLLPSPERWRYPRCAVRLFWAAYLLPVAAGVGHCEAHGLENFYGKYAVSSPPPKMEK